jgi:hypothetical protein
VNRSRVALKHAPDAAARATAIQQLATLLKVSDAIILTSVNGKTIVQTWRDREPGFSALRERRKEDRPIDLLRPLAPPPREPVIRPPEPPAVVHRDEKRWYQRWSYRVGIGGTLVIGALVLVARAFDRSVTLDTNPTVGRSELGNR